MLFLVSLDLATAVIAQAFPNPIVAIAAAAMGQWRADSSSQSKECIL